MTDADIVLGYINPDYYFGGRARLNKDRSFAAIKEHIADPLDIEVEEAALRIKRIVDGNMGNEIFKRRLSRASTPASSCSSRTAAPGRPIAAATPVTWG